MNPIPGVIQERAMNVLQWVFYMLVLLGGGNIEIIRMTETLVEKNI